VRKRVRRSKSRDRSRRSRSRDRRRGGRRSRSRDRARESRNERRKTAAGKEEPGANGEPAPLIKQELDNLDEYGAGNDAGGEEGGYNRLEDM